MTRRGWLYACSGGFFILSLPLAARCVALTRRKPNAPPGDVEKEMVRLTNAARQSAQLPAFYLHPSLTDVARDHAKQIATRTNYDKPLNEQWTPTEQWIEDEFRLYGYGFPVMRYGLRAGFCRGSDGGRLSVPDTFAKWLEEDRAKALPQERGILNPYFADCGVGVVEVDGVYYVSFIFAKRFKTMDIKELFKEKDKDNPGQ
jgi:hypothetical protein